MGAQLTPGALGRTETEMTETPNYISNTEELVGIFGRWPSFHDSEVITLRLEREGPGEFDGPELFVTFHLFQGRADPSRDAGVSWHNHVLATFRFARVSELEIVGFNNQNAVFDLKVEPTAEPKASLLLVTIESSFGMAASFLCSAVAVDNVERRAPTRSVYLD